MQPEKSWQFLPSSSSRAGSRITAEKVIEKDRWQVRTGRAAEASAACLTQDYMAWKAGGERTESRSALLTSVFRNKNNETMILCLPVQTPPRSEMSILGIRNSNFKVFRNCCLGKDLRTNKKKPSSQFNIKKLYAKPTLKFFFQCA